MQKEILDYIRSPRLRRLAETWFARRGDARVTRREDIGPADFPALLPHVFLYDFEPETRRLTLRLAGEEIRNLMPKAARGLTLEEIVPEAALETVRGRYLRVCEEPAIMHAAGRVFLDPQATGSGERLLLPLGDATGAVRQMIGATIYVLPDLRRDDSVFAHEEVETTFFPL
ncbi:MAG TPA: PAS domain-containing protein [Ferrovibrio sp.]|uniref:PAS domain-containing protein n=1 Tax=Ferrovibrio sp. TaxID=1917215 RepID=UPI002B4B47C7|nr:PAS domain-containing protein [Ferrovibrio sp.]HLT79078.1 PAS domain-containing protein [Ferrovibrio sp.]